MLLRPSCKATSDLSEVKDRGFPPNLQITNARSATADSQPIPAWSLVKTHICRREPILNRFIGFASASTEYFFPKRFRVKKKSARNFADEKS
jgi:hypothetical protein